LCKAHRKTEGDFSATQITFTSSEFEKHVRDMTKIVNEFGVALEIDPADFQRFGEAALSASKSASTSPHPPSSKI